MPVKALTFPSAPLSKVDALQRFVSALHLPAERVPALLVRTDAFLEGRPDWEMEKSIIRRALESRDANQMDEAFRLFQWKGPLLAVLAPQAEKIGREIGFGEAVDSLGDFWQTAETVDRQTISAWSDLEAGVLTGLQYAPALCDPPGALAYGAIHYLDRQGLRLFCRDEKKRPPLLGLLSRNETALRMATFNLRRESDKVGGEIGFDFPPDLQMQVVPSVYAKRLRKLPLQFDMISSDVFAGLYTRTWASSLRQEAVVATGVKGLTAEGLTPLEHLELVLKEAKREDVTVIDILGFLPSRKMMGEMREFLAGDRTNFSEDTWSVTLACPDAIRTEQLLRRWLGDDVKIAKKMCREREDTEEVLTYVAENPDCRPPLRITIVFDRDVIRANELASIYKNLAALDLGNFLFEEMFKAAVAGKPWDSTLRLEFAKRYRERMEMAERDVRRALELRKIPEGKRIILQDIRHDMYGSWDTENFENLYRLVRQIFGPVTTAKEAAEGMILLKLWIQIYYSVRNTAYAFCAAADHEAARNGISLDSEALRAAVAGLAGTKLLPKERELPADEEALRRLGLVMQRAPHRSFSMIPSGLFPESLQIARLLPLHFSDDDLFIRISEELPTFQSAFEVAERFQHKSFLDPQIHASVVKICSEMAGILPGRPGNREIFLRKAIEIRALFEGAGKILETSDQILPRRRLELLAFLRLLIQKMSAIIVNTEIDEILKDSDIALINQATFEVLARANRFYILPLSEIRDEAKFILERLDQLVAFSETGKWDNLYPAPAGGMGEGASPERDLTRDRSSFFESIGPGLVDLVRSMSLEIHTATVKKGDLLKNLDSLIAIFEGAAGNFKDQPVIRDYVRGLAVVLRSTRTKISQKRIFDGSHRLLIHGAVIEALIQARRFIVFPEERAVTELEKIRKGFLQIRAYVGGIGKRSPKVQSPFWDYQKA